MEEIKKCPICEAEDFHHRLTIKDHSITHEDFELTTCANCSFVVTSPRPEIKYLSRYYESENYISHSATKKGLINKLYHQVQRYNLSLKYKAIKQYVPRGTWMDYGAGNGAFLAYIKGKSHSAMGFEPDKKARSIGARKGISIADSLAYPDSGEAYASITMWHVLEHIPELKEIIQIHHDHLLPDGILTIAVPNHLSYDARFYKQYWAAYDVPRHLWHFSEKNVKDLIIPQGFEFIKKAPMVYDSYYVSMLSEKYKKGLIIRGVLLGFLSNFYARVSGYPFSSQIYIFRKKEN